ncbi:element excision factor XisH family protein [Dolichospermum circinale CS-545/17]|uniref:Element excision factor XisH family protein n=2 Tax=Dolichospermum circinale TaxID=109265 RepID=A0ABT5A6W2_9CYAN|nr:element excision factor XisH family protein [Dolichospermum circinale]MDB9457174.1 element excision factor XisH family protein [Dolichospermum circinale CS-545/17]MDB9469813.1 element excision factor XisH family protein [Dolichospermum circinale CS-539]MDB9487683.1 element excision factor XisH family protein [Dolichospermum circinale CS-537/01]
MPAPQEFHDSTLYFIRSETAVVYRKLIQLTQPEYKLYLAIDDVVYDKFFQRQSVQAVIQENHLLLIVVNTKKEEIQKWIN